MARQNRPKVAVLNKNDLDFSELEKFLQTPEGLWRNARMVSADVFYTFAPAIKALMPKFLDGKVALENGLPTMAVDKYYRCYVNNQFTSYLATLADKVSPTSPCPTCGDTYHHPLSYIAGVICHESQHPSREHGKRAMDMGIIPVPVEERTAETMRELMQRHRLWNCAGDLEINDDLLQCFKLANEEYIQKHQPRPRLCLPFFPQMKLVYKGQIIERSDIVWTSFEPQVIGNDLDVTIFSDELAPGQKITVQFDGNQFNCDGKVYKRGQRFPLGKFEVQLDYGSCLIPKMFREPEFAKHGIDFPDDQIAEVYYLKLLDLKDKEDQDQNCPICGDPFSKPQDQSGDEQQAQDGSQGDSGEGQDGQDGQEAGDGSGGEDQKQGKKGGKGKGKNKGQGKGDSHDHQHGHGGEPCPHPGHHKKRGLGSMMDNQGQDCGSGAHGQRAPYEDGDPSPNAPGISEAEGRAIQREIAKEIKKASATRGNVPAGMLRWADAVLEPAKIDWRKQFRKIVRKAISRAYGHEQRTWRSLGRSSASTGYKLLYPSTYTPVPRVGVVLDTSGSMGAGEDSPLYDAYCEVEGICKALNARLVFVSVDAEAGEVQEISSFKQAKVTGGGGTDMRLGIEALAKMKQPPNVCVVLTDGYTPWPDKATKGMDILAAIVGQGGDMPAASVPEFIKTVVIDPNQGKDKK